MVKKPVLNFSQQFDHNIWKIHAFETSPYIILEIRDQDQLQVTFTIINLARSEIVAQNVAFEESWWITVAQATNEQIVFYTFDADSNPKVNEYIGFNINTLKPEWQRKDFNLKNLENDLPPAKNNCMEIPFQYQAGSDYYKTVEQFVGLFYERSIVKAVDYLERDHQVLISYFLDESEKLVNYLLVIDRDKNVLMHEKLGEFGQGITDNTFFVINNTLIFVKGVTDFFMYDLSL